MHLNAPILKKSIFSQELWSAVANQQLVGDAHLFRVEDLREKGGMSGNVRQHVPTIIGLARSGQPARNDADYLFGRSKSVNLHSGRTLRSGEEGLFALE